MPVRSSQVLVDPVVPTVLVRPTYGSVGDPITAVIRNTSGALLYIGGEDVTSANGFIVRLEEVVSFDLIAGDILYAINPGGGGGGTVSVLKFRQ